VTSLHENAEKVRERASEDEPKLENDQLFLEYSTDLLVLVGFDSCFKRVSPSFLRVLGWAKEEVLSKSFLDFVYPDDREKSAAKAKGYEKGEQAIHFENRYRCKDGSYKWISWDSYPLPKEKLVVGVGRDITERKKAEMESAILASFPTLNPSPIVEVDFDCKVLYSNPAAKSVASDSAKSDLGDSFLSDCKPVVDALRVEKKSSFVRDVRIGDDWFLQQFYLVPETQRVRIYAMNITELKRTEKELQEARDYLNNLLNYANAPIIVWDTQFRITKFNHAFERLTGSSSNDVLGKHLSILFPEDKREEAMSYIQRTLAGEHWETVEIPIAHVDRTVSTLLWNSANVYDASGKNVVATIAQGHDITERKKAEQALRESEEALKESQEIAHLGSWKLDLMNNVLSWSDEVYRIFGLKPQEFGATYEAFLDAVHPDDRKKVDDAYSGSLREGKDMYEVEHRVVRKYTGEIRTVHEKCYHVRDASGRIIQSIGIVHDITESKKAEEALRKSEEKYRSLVEPNIIGILSADPEKIIDANEAFLKIVGYTYDDLVEGKIRWKDMTPAEYQVLDARALEEMLSTGSCAPYEKEYFRKDGNRVPVLMGAALLQKSPLQWVCFVMDMTERKKLEERLRNSERFSAIGQTAAMVGHDLRNPLQAIVGFVGLAEEQLNGMDLSSVEKQEFKSNLRAIYDQTRYMNKIVSDLQDYSQPLALDFVRTDVGQLINDTIAASDIPENVTVSVKIPRSFPQMKVDPTTLRRVLSNLITNAVQAMPTGGKLNLRVSKKTDTQSLVISIEDTGTGIREADIPKIFTPLFTTKSKGQGFGLPVCKRLLEAQGGTITFKSRIGQGSKFTITIPLTK